MSHDITFPTELLEILNERNEWVNHKGMKELAELRGRIESLELPTMRSYDASTGVVKIMAPDIESKQVEEIIDIAQELLPWRKGPFDFFGVEIDAEWRSDLKWDRLAKALPPLKKARVLDVGCNNGYFMFKLAQLGAAHVLGIDPVPFNQVQFELLKKISAAQNLQFELLGFEHLAQLPSRFDVILSMGVLYHHRHPIEQLQTLKAALRPEGALIIETIVIPSLESVALFPEDRYAKMRNVWFVPSVSCLENMLKRCGYKNVELIDFGKTTPAEQRLTKWCPPPRQSLADFLDPNDENLTIEGHPAPHRAIFKATI